VHVTTVNWATPAGIPASGEVTKVAHRAMLAKIDQTSGSHHGKREWLVVDVALTEVRLQAYFSNDQNVVYASELSPSG
jgi:hypothetical protein